MTRRRLLVAFVCALVAAFVLVSTLPIVQVVWAAQNQLGPTETFGGTNADTLATYDANWVSWDTSRYQARIRGTPGVGSPAGGEVQGGNIRNGFTWTNDQWAELKIDGTNVADYRFLVCVRLTQGTANDVTGYCGGVHRDDSGGDYKIYKFTSTDAYTALATGTHTYAANDVVNFQAVGTVLTLQLNGSGTEATYDTSGDMTKYSTGSPGLVLGDSTITKRLGGTWKAGSVGAAASSARRSFFFGIGP